MNGLLILVFGITMVFLAFVIAFISATTSLFYRGVSKGKLSLNELKVLNGSATILTRISIFFPQFICFFYNTSNLCHSVNSNIYFLVHFTSVITYLKHK